MGEDHLVRTAKSEHDARCGQGHPRPRMPCARLQMNAKTCCANLWPSILGYMLLCRLKSARHKMAQVDLPTTSAPPPLRCLSLQRLEWQKLAQGWRAARAHHARTQSTMLRVFFLNQGYPRPGSWRRPCNRQWTDGHVKLIVTHTGTLLRL